MSPRSIVLLTLSLILALAAILPIPTATAADPALTDGNYLMTVSGGVITIRPIQWFGPSPSPNPTPTPSPTPDVLTPRAKLFQTAAQQATADPNRQQTAANLAALFQEVSRLIKAGTIPENQQAQSLALDIGMTQVVLKSTAAWKPFRDAFSAAWNDQTRTGFSSDESVKLLADASAGLMAAAPSYTLEKPDTDSGRKAIAGGLQAIDWNMILQIIELVLKFIGPFLSFGPEWLLKMSGGLV